MSKNSYNFKRIYSFSICFKAQLAAAIPDQTAPSSVAGKPVFVQSPARNMLANPIIVAGRRATCSGVCSKVARFSLMILHGPRLETSSSKTRLISAHILSAISISDFSENLLAALIVTEITSPRTNIHSAVPPTTPMKLVSGNSP